MDQSTSTASHQSRVSGAFALLVAQALVLVFGYVTHLWIGRILGPAAYGIYGVVLSIQTMLGLFLALGVPMAVSRFVARDTEHARSTLNQAIRLQLAIGVALAVLTALLSPFLARLLGDETLTPYISFIAIVILFQAGYPIFVQYLSGLHLFYKQAALTSIYAVVKLAGALSLIYVWHVYGAFAGFAIGGIVAAVVGWYWTRHTGGTSPSTLPLRRFLSFAGIYVLILFSLQLLISLDLFMVKALLGSDTDTGYYNSAVTLSRISYMLLQSLTFILLPSVSALTRPGADREEAIRFIRESLRYLTALIIPSIALASATSPTLIRLFFSAEYLPAAPALTVLMVGVGFIAFYLLLVNIVAGAGRAVTGLGITIILLIISALLGRLLIPQLGILGAAWQTTITGAIGFLILSIYTFRTFRLPLPIKSTANIIIASTVITLAAYYWTASPLLLPFQYLLLFFIYGLILYFLREIKPQDLALLSSLHPSLDRFKPKP